MKTLYNWRFYLIYAMANLFHFNKTLNNKESRNQYMHARSKELETKIGWGSYFHWHNPIVLQKVTHI